MYQAQGTVQELELSAEERFCKLSVSAAAVMREHGAMAYGIYTLLATNARVTRKGELCARESIGSLVRLTGCSESAVRRNLNRLKSSGLVRQWFSNNNNSYFFLATGHGVERFDSVERRAGSQAASDEAGAVDNSEAGVSEEREGGVVLTGRGCQKDTPLYIDFKKREKKKGCAHKRLGENPNPSSQGEGGLEEAWTSEEVQKLRRMYAAELGVKLGVPLGIKRAAREERCMTPRSYDV
ncbi:MAG: transcriptional regulator [Chloroflexi bacterium]|nr:transcriptional regulator [Chloroflexota bacterium]